MDRCTDLLAALPAPVYMTDAKGRLTFYNEAAAQLWGRRPPLGETCWCGSLRLWRPEGGLLPHEESVVARALRDQRSGTVLEAIVERPDGAHVAIEGHASLLKDGAGRTEGVLVALTDVGVRNEDAIVRERLAAIVASSQDAIVSKSLEGRITSWNEGAERIFGYAAEEMIGQSITRIIPPELHPEEAQILARLRRGERIEHFDTVRVAKDGRRVDISLTVSPLRDRAGRIIGASKVARDVTDRKRDERLQRLLLAELNHRVKNTLAMIQSIAAQSLRHAATPEGFVDSFNGRLQALARAHTLLVEGKMQGADLAALVREQVLLEESGDPRIACSGPPVSLEPHLAVQLALVLHELATNSRKHGALALPEGRVEIRWCVSGAPTRELRISWLESGVVGLVPPRRRGFGTSMIARALEANGGRSEVDYGKDGLRCAISVPLPQPSGGPPPGLEAPPEV